MTKLLLGTYGALSAAPFILFAALMLVSALYPLENLSRSSGRVFEVVWTATLTAAAVALSLTLVLFPRVAAFFGPRGLARWPLYAGLFGLCVSAFLATAFALAVFRPIQCPHIDGF